MADIVEDWEVHRGGGALLEELDKLLKPDVEGNSTEVEGVKVEDVRRALDHCLKSIADRNA